MKQNSLLTLIWLQVPIDDISGVDYEFSWPVGNFSSVVSTFNNNSSLISFLPKLFEVKKARILCSRVILEPYRNCECVNFCKYTYKYNGFSLA